MKTLGRVLIILAVFALVMGITYVLVNAGTSETSASTTQFDRGGGERPAFAEGQRPEFGRERGGGGWIFGALKNIGIVAIIVMLVVIPKGWLQHRRRTAQVSG